MAINGYTYLAELKEYCEITSTDTANDILLEAMISAASRYIDRHTRRWFYPAIETRYFDVPGGRRLELDEDLLDVITLTNGDSTVLTTTDYYLESKNYYPKWAITLKESSSVMWECDSDGNTEGVITVLGTWGHRKDFASKGWRLGSTLNEISGITASELTFTVTSGTLFEVGHTIKIGTEVMNITGKSTNDLTVSKRGDNGSTAAIHSNADPVYIWSVDDEIRIATLIIAANLYRGASGQSTSSEATVTASGVVLSPTDIPSTARALIDTYQRLI